MTVIHAKKALLDSGWAQDVRLQIGDGSIDAIEAGAAAWSGDFVADIVIPGLANGHSHAFQRALVGHTERRGPAAEDTFWNWRTQMYRLAGLIDADALTVIARQAYSEMMACGYTSVAEFHYVHRGVTRRDGIETMCRAIFAAAADTGIRLTYVPVLYERAGFDQPEPTVDQHRFAMTPEEFGEHYDCARETATSSTVVGVGAHSLRAVTEASLGKLADLTERDGCPMHIHIAEQAAEVDQCLEQYNARPVEWLMREFSPNNRWCLVHATHVSEEEVDSLCKTGAVVCLCPSTEANLGDGLFPLRSWLERGGRIAIGSDSQVTTNPFEELRWLEYGQRLMSRSRNVAAVNRDHTGGSLFELVLEGGSLACGHGSDQLQAGGNADLVTLDGENPTLAGHDTESILDALVFSGASLPIERVMVAGEWRVIDGSHIASAQVSADYLQTVRGLWEETAYSS